MQHGENYLEDLLTDVVIVVLHMGLHPMKMIVGLSQ